MSDTAIRTEYPAGGLMRMPADVHTMAARCLRLSLRNVDGLITALALPVMLMLMFVYLFGGAIPTGGRYVDYVVPGVLVVCASFGSATTAVSVAQDLHSAVIDRFTSLDVRGDVFLAGHVVASVLRNIVSTTVVFGVAFAIGFRPHGDVGQWVAAVGILLLFVLALSWLAAAIGIVASSPEGASGISFLVSFLPYPSSAFVPVHTMPSWLQGFARDQPVTPVIDSLRDLLGGAPAAATPWHAIGWSLGVMAGAIVLANALLRRRAS
jgi:ABC-2 type transport system permease protein